MMSDWKHNTDGHTGSNPIVKGSNLTVIISQHSFKTFQNLHFYHHSKKYIQLDSFVKSLKLNLTVPQTMCYHIQLQNSNYKDWKTSLLI